MAAQTPEELHTQFVATFNAGNLDAVMALYEKTAVLIPQPGLITTAVKLIAKPFSSFWP